MSHAATHWLATVPPDHMTHGEFRVLFHLCDCHNASMGCFPKQTYLREHTGLSNGGLNKALAELERKGLLHRRRERDERTNRQKPTRYILGFEMEKPQEPTPLSGAGAVSTFDAVPSPLSEGSVSTGVESYIDEPVREPVIEPCADRAHGPSNDFDNEPCLTSGHGRAGSSKRDGLINGGRVSKQDTGLEALVSDFLSAFPKTGSRDETAKEIEVAIAAGAEPNHLVVAARAYAAEQKGNAPQYIARPENWLRRERWREVEVVPTVDRAVILHRRAGWIAEGKPWAATSITAAEPREVIGAGLVTAEQCKRAGVIV